MRTLITFSVCVCACALVCVCVRVFPHPQDSLEEKRKRQRSERLERIFQLSEAHGALAPVYGTEVLDFCTLPQPVASPIGPRSPGPSHPTFWTYTEAARQAVLFPQHRLDQLSEIIERLAGLSANGKRVLGPLSGYSG